jgi:hypothetical protein
VTITVTVDIGNFGGVDETQSFSLGNGECRDVWVVGGHASDLVTVTESVPNGYTASYQRSTITNGSIVTDPETPGNSASGLVDRTLGRGALAIFKNTPQQQPNQGCTPGYWKQSHHFDERRCPLN